MWYEYKRTKHNIESCNFDERYVGEELCVTLKLRCCVCAENSAIEGF